MFYFYAQNIFMFLCTNYLFDCICTGLGSYKNSIKHFFLFFEEKMYLVYSQNYFNITS